MIEKTANSVSKATPLPEYLVCMFITCLFAFDSLRVWYGLYGKLNSSENFKSNLSVEYGEFFLINHSFFFRRKKYIF